jgi:glycosyltransferase involved in cell wall biosynthesis
MIEVAETGKVCLPEPGADTNEPELVSVAMVVYNGQRDVRRAIDSVLAQEHPNFELIVVDDGSTDDTWRILTSYGDRLRAVRQANGGLPLARNAAVSATNGRFVALMDHDDLCHPNRLAAQVAVMRAYPQVGLVSSEFSAFDDTGSISNAYAQTYYSRCDPRLGGMPAMYPKHDAIDLAGVLKTGHPTPQAVHVFSGNVYNNLATGNFVHPPTVMFRREMLEQVGLFDPAMRTMCDWEWIVRMARKTQLAYIDAPLLDYRRSPAQMSSIQHAPRGSLDALLVAMHLCAQDPALLKQDDGRMRANLADLHANAAYANAEVNSPKALRLLTDALVRYRYQGSLTRATLIRALVPTPLLNRMRSKRSLQPQAN